MNKNLESLIEFIDLNDLKKNFTCNFNIETLINECNIDCEALMLFDGAKQKIEIVVSANIDNDLFPISFPIEKQDLDVVFGDLLIHGEHASIGHYKAKIKPYQNI
jgi:hypothetical protein